MGVSLPARTQITMLFLPCPNGFGPFLAFDLGVGSLPPFVGVDASPFGALAGDAPVAVFG
jgi:hypothetical protein